jgi:phage FluMu protein Com
MICYHCKKDFNKEENEYDGYLSIVVCPHCKKLNSIR